MPGLVRVAASLIVVLAAAPGTAAASDVAAWVLQPSGQVVVLGSLAPTFPDPAASGNPAVAVAAGLDATVPVLAGRDGRTASGDGSATSQPLERRERAVELLRAGGGLWLVTSRARVLPLDGAAASAGTPVKVRAGDAVIDATATPTGLGAWLLTTSGRVLSVGDAAPLPRKAGRGAGAIAADMAGDGLWVASRRGGLRALLGAPGLTAPRTPLVALASLLNAPGVVAADRKGRIWLLRPSNAPIEIGRVRGKVADLVAAPRLEQAVVGLDAARAATATIGLDGGTIRVTTAAGGTVDLVVPRGALPAEQTITVTPLTSLSGVSSAGSLIAGVDLQPAGLRLALPARVTVQLPADARSGLLAIAWSGADDRIEFPNWRLSSDRRVATIEVDHFSGTGVVAASAAALALLGEQVAANLPSAFRRLNPQIVQTKLALDAARIETPPNQVVAGEKLTLLRRHFADLHEQGVAPLLGPAQETMPGFLRASKAAFTFASWLATIGDEDAGDEAAKTEADRTAIAAAARTLVLRYLVPRCDAPASILGDWLVHPLFLATAETIVADVTTIQDLIAPPGGGAPPHCLRLVLHEVEFPSQITSDVRMVSLQLQPRYEVAAPGSLGTEPQRVENTTFDVFGTIDGATADGEEQFFRRTDTAGRITIALDRGADEANRRPRLTVHLTITPVAPPQTSQLPTIFNAPIGTSVQPGEAVPSQLLPITITTKLTAEGPCGFPPDVVPPGSYALSCTACTMTGTVLGCSCRRIDGEFQSTQLDVGSCRTEPANSNGVLECTRCS